MELLWMENVVRAKRLRRTHLNEAGYDIHTVQELLDHQDVATTQIYAYVLNRAQVRCGVRWMRESPDRSTIGRSRIRK